MKKKFLVILGFLVLVVLWLLLRFVIGGPEDDWICESGQWVRHGHPRQSAPEEICKQ